MVRVLIKYNENSINWYQHNTTVHSDIPFTHVYISKYLAHENTLLAIIDIPLVNKTSYNIKMLNIDHIYHQYNIFNHHNPNIITKTHKIIRTSS